LLADLPRAGVPAVRLLDVISNRLRVLRVHNCLFLIHDPAKLFLMQLDGAIHVLDNGVSAPVKLPERACPEAGRAAGGYRDYTHRRLSTAINRVGHEVAVAAVGGQPVVWQTLRPSTDRNNVWTLEALPYRVVIVWADCRVRVHQRNDIVTIKQFEVGRRASDGTRLTDVLLVAQHVHAVGASDIARAIFRAVIANIDIGR